MPLPQQQEAAEPAVLESSRSIGRPVAAAVAQAPLVSADQAAGTAFATESSSQEEAVSMAAQPSTAESAGEPCVGTLLGQGSAGPAGGDSAAVEALPAAKILPEQDRPVLLTPRTPREDAGVPYTVHV